MVLAEFAGGVAEVVQEHGERRGFRATKPSGSRGALTHIAGVLRLFQPEHDPGDIKPKRTYARRTRYFARNELSRLCMDALRVADGSLMTTDDIAGRIITAKGFDTADTALRKAIGEQCVALLRSFRKRATVEQIGLGRSVRWQLAKQDAVG